MTMDFDPVLLALGTAPIPGDAPAGQSARYEPEFESMQAEIEKLTGLSGSAPDWNLVAEHAATVLSSKSKDLLAACYLCAALRETRGWAGLADGLNLIKALLAGFWDTLHPAKLRVRKTAIDWLLDRLNALVEAAPVEAADRDALAACTTLIDELTAFGETRWEGDAPTLWSLGKALKARSDALPAEVAEVAAAPDAAGSGSAPGARPAVAGPSAALSPAGAVASRAEAYRQIISAADHLQATEPHSPVPYLLRRAVAWGTMPLPQLYAELQRAGTVWDLVLQQTSSAAASGAAPAASDAAAPAPAAPAPEPAAPRRRGDY
jgi:type VI secretion system protein VasJ